MTRLWILTAAALFACAPEEGEGDWVLDLDQPATDLYDLPPMDRAPAPGVLSLSTTAWLSTQVTTVQVSNAGPGDTVALLVSGSPNSGPTCPAVMNPECLAFANPIMLGTEVANGAGVATFSITVPNPPPPAAQIQLQAVVLLGAGGADTSNAPVVDLHALDSDLDDDGLTLEDELLFGTDPEDADSDGGGARDGSEVMSGTDPANPTDDLNYFDVATLSMSAQFGIDAASRPVAVDLAGTLMEPSIDIHLGRANWTGDLGATNDYCTVVLEIDTAGPGAFAAADPRLYWGVDHDRTSGTSDCLLDPLDWGAGTPVEVFANPAPWGVGVGDIDPYTDSVLAPYLDAASAAAIFGGALVDPLLGLGQVDTMYGFAYAVDPATGEVFLDINNELVFIDSANIDLGAGMITEGWYNISSLYFYTFY